ncbi:MAG: hypothetical protein QN229_03290 [Desulfurococcaceae archaeon TW002]
MKKEARVLVYELMRCRDGKEYVAYLIMRGAFSVEHVGLLEGGSDSLTRFISGSSIGRSVRVVTRVEELGKTSSGGLVEYIEFIKKFFMEVYKLMC